MAPGATGQTLENVEEHKRLKAWKQSDVEKVKPKFLPYTAYPNQYKYYYFQGYIHRKRNCSRTLGGKFCQHNGEDYKGKIIINSFECDSGECPGKLHQHRDR